MGIEYSLAVSYKVKCVLNHMFPPKLQLSFNWWMYCKLWYIYITEYCSNKKEWISDIENTWKNLKFYYYSKWKKPATKVTYCTIPFMWHSEKGKSIRTKSSSVIVRGWDGGRHSLQREIWGGVEIFYIILLNIFYIFVVVIVTEIYSLIKTQNYKPKSKYY